MFRDLQNRLDESQSMVDSLLSREPKSTKQEPARSESDADRRRTRNQRVRNLLDTLREARQASQRATDDLQQQIDRKQHELEFANDRLAEQERSAIGSQHEQARLLEQIAELENQIAELNSDRQTAQQQHTDLTARWQHARYVGRNRAIRLVQALRETRRQMESLSNQSTSQPADNPSEVERWKSDHDTLLAEVQQLRESQKKAESELAWAEQEIAQVEQQSADLRGHIASLEQSLRNSEEVRSETQEPSAGDGLLQAQLATAIEEKDALQRQIAEYAQRQEELHTEIERLTQSEADSCAKLESAIEQAEILRRRIDEQADAFEAATAVSDLRDDPTETESNQNLSDPLASPGGDALAALRAKGLLCADFDEEEPSEVEDVRSTRPETHADSSDFVRAIPEKFEQDRDDDEESINAYMQGLLDRMRSKNGESSSPVPVVTDAKSIPKPKPSRKKLDATPASLDSEKPAVEELLSSNEFVPSKFAPEQTSDIRKLRELANETAKEAIDSATLHRWERLCKSKLLVSIGALLAGGILHFLSDSYLSWSFLTACLAYVITVFWWLQSAVIFSHVKSHRREKFEKRMQQEIFNGAEDFGATLNSINEEFDDTPVHEEA